MKEESSEKAQNLQSKWLSIEQTCRLLMISKRTCSSYRRRGILPFVQISRKIYFKASDLDDYLEAHYIKANYQKEKGGIQ
jgi:excisionase family DNA binding protein